MISRLEEQLKAGAFAVTAECGPPRGANAGVIQEKIQKLANRALAVNVTDNQTAIVRMSSIAAAIHLVRAGVEPVMQMVVRDRNRIAIQSDIMGAYSLGIRNILCLSGDHQKFGSQPDAMNVFDIDSTHLIRTVRDMRETGRDMSGHRLDKAPKMFIGAAANPFADPFEYRVLRLAKKIEAGADFIQTQCIYNTDRFRRWMGLAHDMGLTEKAFILGGVTPLKSAGMARYMAQKVAGMEIPDAIVKRMEQAGDPAQEGVKICVETIEALKETPGVAGVHIMAIEWEEIVPQIVDQAGLTPEQT